ncbi:MAG: hypothetical protein SGPRY_004833 [Prymnesium sp.]
MRLSAPPPVVIFPGFGNDASDYSTPLGAPLSDGFVSALGRRGMGASVVPIARLDWLRVAGGLLDPSFVRGEGRVGGLAFGWYLRKGRAAVEEAVAKAREGEGGGGEGGDERGGERRGGDHRALLVCHSAGGWLARGMCLLDPTWARTHVRGIVTLGSPHLPPPPEVGDPTRGSVSDVASLATTSPLPKDIFTLSVASGRVVGESQEGKEGGGGQVEAFAFNSYKMVCGEGGVAGDGARMSRRRGCGESG